MAPENADKKQGSRFQKGQSGNPLGRPRGARNSATLAAEALLDGEVQALTRKAIRMALDGDPVALRVRKDRPVAFALPPINTARDAADVMSDVLSAVASGQITPADASEISKAVTFTVEAFEAAELMDEKDLVKQLTNDELLRIAARGP